MEEGDYIKVKKGNMERMIAELSAAYFDCKEAPKVTHAYTYELNGGDCFVVKFVNGMTPSLTATIPSPEKRLNSLGPFLTKLVGLNVYVGGVGINCEDFKAIMKSKVGEKVNE